MPTVQVIKHDAFKNCFELRTVNLGFCTEIEDNAFMNCTELSNIYGGAFLENVGDGNIYLQKLLKQ